MYEGRIMSSDLRKKITDAKTAAQIVQSGMTVAMSGFGFGDPKAIPYEMIKNTHDLKIIQSAGKSQRLLTALAESGAVKRYAPFQLCKAMRNEINSGKIEYMDIHLSELEEKIASGELGHIDVAIIECCKVNADGSFVPTLSVGASVAMVQCADKVLLEINTAVPSELEGIHDIHNDINYVPEKIFEKSGTNAIPCPVEKLAGIVITDEPEEDIVKGKSGGVGGSIAKSVLSIITDEIKSGNLPENFTFQSGVGDVANSVIGKFREAGFKDLTLYSGLLSDSSLDLVLDGIVKEASACALHLSTKGFQKLYDNLETVKKHVVLRSQSISNGASQIKKFSPVSMNMALEIDIYGNVNSTHAFGSKMMNGVGGAADFSTNSSISMFMTPSIVGGGKISCIVPKVPHVDNCARDVDYVITEIGYANLKGKTPLERAESIIENCAHPDYRQALRDYVETSKKVTNNFYEPTDLEKAFSFHTRFLKTGSMK